MSDIAAMGGTPTAAILSLGVGPKQGISFVKSFMDGLETLASQAKIPLIGGDTVESPKSVVVTITLLGICLKKHLVTRSGAKIGDHIWVSGPVGSSAAGLHLLLEKPQPPPSFYAPLIQCHQRPRPRLSLGKALAESGLVHAMIDLSDGMAKDLRHICAESKKGAVIHEASIPIATELQRLASDDAKDALTWALCGGEDYELLFTAPPSNQEKISALCEAMNTPAPICIGSIIKGDAVYLESEQGRVLMPDKGYHHFSST
jgi:thiamine-monophosphate kinase